MSVASSESERRGWLPKCNWIRRVARHSSAGIVVSIRASRAHGPASKCRLVASSRACARCASARAFRSSKSRCHRLTMRGTTQSACCSSRPQACSIIKSIAAHRARSTLRSECRLAATWILAAACRGMFKTATSVTVTIAAAVRPTSTACPRRGRWDPSCCRSLATTGRRADTANTLIANNTGSRKGNPKSLVAFIAATDSGRRTTATHLRPP